jgi:heptosyltransferase-2
VTWVCGEVVEPLVRVFDGIAETIAVDQRALFHGGSVARARVILRLWSALIRRGFDRAIVLHPDPRYRILVLPLVGVPTVFLSRKRHGEMIPVPARFLGDEYARLVGGTAHVGPIERRYTMADLRAKIPSLARSSDGRKRVALVPGGARNVLRDDALRRWPSAHYARVAAALLGEGIEVTLVGSADDAWVRPDFAGLPVTDRLGSLSLIETLGVLRDADLVISHDTGPMHLARLVRTPLLALFGPTIPAQVLSMDHTVTTLWGGADLACRPCFDGREFAACASNICLSGISPDEVIGAARRILREPAGDDREVRVG